jgi:hypothetical protein
LLGLFLILGSAASVRARIVAHWKLDDKTGTIARDSSGNNYNGTLLGSATWIEGVVAGALEVQGNGRVDFGNPTGWPAGKSPRSLCGWGRPNTVAAGYRWMASYGTAGTGQAMFIGMNGNRMIGGGYNGDDVDIAGVWAAGEWKHVALTYDGTTARLYGNGVEIGAVAKNWNLVLNRAFLGEQVNAAGEYWNGAFDDVRLYDHVLTPAEFPAIMAGVPLELAKDPVPEDEATDVHRDAVLNWTAGRYPSTHDVYLGTVAADVNNASRTNPMGLLAGQGQDDTTFDPTAVFAYGQTYYWRIDEVNKSPDNTISKGVVWSFTAEPYSYAIAGVTATASSAQPSMGPENTVNGSGLTGDLHGTEGTTMWLSGGAQPNWIQYQFDKVYKLYDLKVWNTNQLIETFIGFGARKVTIEYSADGTTWATLDKVPEFARASGTPGYAANTTVNFGGVMAKYVKLTINSTWGGVSPVTGLSEVRFSYVPVQAFAPQPATAATGVAVDAILNWRPGREAGSHKVFFGADQTAVTNGTAPARTVTDHAFASDSLNFATTYYWRVDEVNTVTYPGDVWSFTTVAYGVVDDFESYNDDDNRIYDSWIDGYTDGKSGSVVGNMAAPFAEKTIIHGGKQSMPFEYDNAAFTFSEATRTFDAPQNWTARGIKTLSVYFSGVAGNGGQLYAKINSTKIAYDGDAADLARFGWQVWNIDLSRVGNVGSVRSLTIGIEGSGAKGKLYLDDIRLYPKTPEFIIPVQPAATNLVGYYTFDEGSGARAGDSSGKGHPGTIKGNPQWSTGVVGGALTFDGSANWVDLGNPADWPAGAEPRSMCAWAKLDDLTAVWHWIAAYGSPITSQAMFIGSNGTALYGGGYGNDVSVAGFWAAGVWHHIALTYDGTIARLYADGVEVVSAAKTWNLVRSQARIGQQVNELSEFWDGAIDDVRIYSQALSPEEVAGLAGQTKPRHKPL